MADEKKLQAAPPRERPPQAKPDLKLITYLERGAKSQKERRG